MRKTQQLQNETKTLVLVSSDFLNDLKEKQEQILAALTNKFQPKDSFGDYISESDAKEILGRKTTWFWNLRKQGKIPFTKVGAKIFYSKAEILKFMESNKE